MPHHGLHVHAARARRQYEPRRILVIRLVAQILDHRQLLAAHLRGDLLEHLGTGRLVRELGDDYLTVFGRVSRA